MRTRGSHETLLSFIFEVLTGSRSLEIASDSGIEIPSSAFGSLFDITVVLKVTSLFAY